MTTYIRLGIAFALAAILAFAGFTIYRAGKASVRAEWNAEKLKQKDDLAAFNFESRQIEQKRQSTVMEAVNEAKTRETTLRRDSAAAGTELAGLRDDLTRARSDLPGDTLAACNQRTAALGRLLDSSGEVLVRIASQCDRHVSDLKTLIQAWPK